MGYELLALPYWQIPQPPKSPPDACQSYLQAILPTGFLDSRSLGSSREPAREFERERPTRSSREPEPVSGISGLQTTSRAGLVLTRRADADDRGEAMGEAEPATLDETSDGGSDSSGEGGWC